MEPPVRFSRPNDMTTRRWLVPILAAVAVLAVVGAVWVTMQGSSDPEPGAAGGGGSPPSAGSEPGSPGSDLPGNDDPVSPAPGGGDVDEGTIAATGYHQYDETRLALVYTNGVPECYGTAGTPRVEETDRAVVVTIPRTPPTGDKDTACIDIALIEKVDITLDAPLGDREVRDGSRGGAVLHPESLPGDQGTT
jgi:hypothetical protein